MEPRRIRRGNNQEEQDSRRIEAMLQWSRGEFAAETPRPAPDARARGHASMEPRRIRRGNRPWSVHCRPRHRSLQWSRGEFAAETTNSVKSIDAECCASMEPRRIRRGNAREVIRRCEVATLLQWSRGEFAAETTVATRDTAGPRELQWSRGEFAAETAQLDVSQQALAALQWSRGEFAAETSRSISRSWWSGWLQWSRGEFAAETLRAVKAAATIAALQWSRGEFAAETHHRAAPHPVGPGPRFNGAAANSPRKRYAWISGQAEDGAASMEPRRIRRGNIDGVPIVRWNGALQWSRGEFAAETIRPRSLATCAPTSFNGAAANSPRKQTGAARTARRRGSFNGAAANSPRKPERFGVKIGGDKGLQWSRGEFAAETECRAAGGVRGGRLQWSRGEFAAETP